MKYKITNFQEREWNGKRYVTANLETEQGEKFENISFWNGEITATSTEIDGELQKNEKGYWKLVLPKKASGAAFQKKNIEEAQERKAQHIAEAQDRSAWMWAKNNAAELVANNDQYKNKPYGEQLDIINELATSIYNQEPLRPF